MNRSSLPVSVNTMKKWFESDDKVLQCTLPFQRHSGMWSPILKSNLVWSMLADSYIPPIVLLKDKRGEDSKGKDIFGYQVLEGQQRLIGTGFIKPCFYALSNMRVKNGSEMWYLLFAEVRSVTGTFTNGNQYLMEGVLLLWNLVMHESALHIRILTDRLKLCLSMAFQREISL